MEQKKVVLYTSGLNGLGLGLAKACTAKDAEVRIFGRSVEEPEDFSRGLPNALAIRANVAEHRADN